MEECNVNINLALVFSIMLLELPVDCSGLINSNVPSNTKKFSTAKHH